MAWFGLVSLGRRSGDLVQAAVLGVIWLLVFAALTFAAQDSPSLASFVARVLYMVPIAVATGLSAFAAVRTRGRVRLAWRLLLASNALWLAADLAWTLYAYLTLNGAPVPSLADVGWLLQYILALPAVLIGLGVGVLGQARGLLDALLVAAAVAAIGWQVAIGPIAPSSWDLAALTTFTYPVLSVSIGSILFAVLLSRGRRVPNSMIIAAAAYGIGAVGDAGYSYLVAVHSWTGLSWVDIAWQAEAVVLCVAAFVAAHAREGDVQRPRPEHDLAVLPAVVASIAVCGLVLADLIRLGRLSAVTFAVTMLLLIGLLVRQFIATHDRTRLARQLRNFALTDSLTGLRNRRFFDETIETEAEVLRREGMPLSLVLVDLDRFKDVNDTYGHSVGDAVLAEAADRLRRSLRASDLICRYGGEEFMCVLPSAGADEAVVLAQRLRAALSRTPMATIPPGAEAVTLTGSCGVATIETRRQQGPIDVDKLVNRADRALYLAKARGRDRVVGSAEFAERDLDPEQEIPSELIWLADQIDDAAGDYEHSAAVSRWSMSTCARLGLDQATRLRAATAGRLHDIGKVGIGRAVLGKPGRLDSEEWGQMRQHPDVGARLVAELCNRPDLARLVAAHHERYDGSGYPQGKAGEEIPVAARVISVCDAWATMRANRRYSQARSPSEARHELITGRGTQFDPSVVDAFLALVDEGVIDEPMHLGPDTGRSGGDAFFR